MDFSTYVNIIVKFTATAVTAASLEFVFPNPQSNPTPNGEWVELIAGLLQFALFVDVAPSLASAISPASTETGDLGANMIFLLGLWFMPGMVAKIMGWYNSLRLPTGGFSESPSPDEK